MFNLGRNGNTSSSSRGRELVKYKIYFFVSASRYSISGYARVQRESVRWIQFDLTYFPLYVWAEQIFVGQMFQVGPITYTFVRFGLSYVLDRSKG